MWELMVSVLVVLLAFSGLVILIVKLLLQSLSEASAGQVKLQAEALATVLAPVLAPHPQPVAQPDQGLVPVADPQWLQEADSPDLVDELTGRPLSWHTPVLSEAESVGPSDLWAHPE